MERNCFSQIALNETGEHGWVRHSALCCLLVADSSSAASPGPCREFLSTLYNQEESALTPALRMDEQAEQLFLV